MTAETSKHATSTHSKYLWEMADRKDLAFSREDRQRLRDAAVLMSHRPDIDMTGDFQFEVGKTYPTRGGSLVTIVGKSDQHRGYECVQGDDGANPASGYRYSRSNSTSDQGRCTGSPGDYDRNLLPIEIVDPRVTKASPERELLLARAAELSEWLDSQLNETGEEPRFRNLEWMDPEGFTPGEIRAAKIAVGHLLGQDTSALRAEKDLV